MEKEKKIIGETEEERREIMNRLFDRVIVPKRKNKLDVEGLLRLGFTEHDSEVSREKVYRIKPSMYYHNILEMRLKPDLPHSNPNCGILAIYNPPIDDMMMDENGEKTKPIKFPSRWTAIAWHVDTYERLHAIVNSLTQIN
jgi:hypothetical protein